MALVDTATFRPDSRDGSQDFEIPRTIGRELFRAGKIAGDATNGGYMPLDRYIPREHAVPRSQWRDKHPWLRSR